MLGMPAERWLRWERTLDYGEALSGLLHTFHRNKANAHKVNSLLGSSTYKPLLWRLRLPKTTRRSAFDSHYMCKNTAVKTKIAASHRLCSGPRGMSESATTTRTPPHCGIVCTSVYAVPSNTQEALTYFHLFLWRSRLLEANAQKFLQWGQLKTPLPLPLYPHNNHTSSLQTLCYFSFSVFIKGRLKINCCMRSYWGHIL